MMDESSLNALLLKAEDLKAEVHGSRNIFTDKKAQKYELELRETYKSILLHDLDFALKHNVEEHLWKSGFKVSIDLGRKMNPNGFLVCSSYGRKKAESQILLENALRTGAKFYEKLLLEICATFDFNIPFLSDLFKVREECDVQSWEELGYKKPEKWSLVLMCQNCLTHIGNCWRYEVEYDSAYVFLEKALELNLLSGHAHNQFGLLHSYQANLLPCLYHYVRAIATLYPYLKARGNMSVNLEEKSEGYLYMGYIGSFGELGIPRTRIPNFTKYGHVYLMLMGCLCMASQRIPILCALVKHMLHSLEAFLLQTMFQVQSISAVIHFSGTADNQADPRLADPDVLKEKAFQSRPGIWTSLSKVLSKFGDVKNYFEVRMVPLPEDRELEGFTVLQPVFSELRFIHGAIEEELEIYNDPGVKFGFLRAYRLLKFGEWLTEQTEITLDIGSGSSKEGYFEGDVFYVPIDPTLEAQIMSQISSSDDSDFYDLDLFEQFMTMSLGRLDTPQSSRSRFSAPSLLNTDSCTQRRGVSNRVTGESNQPNSTSTQSSSGSNDHANGQRSRRKRSGRKKRRYR